MILLISEFAIARVCIKKSLRSDFEKPNTRPASSSSFTAFGRKLALANFFRENLGLVSLVFTRPCFPGNPALLFSFKVQFNMAGRVGI